MTRNASLCITSTLAIYLNKLEYFNCAIASHAKCEVQLKDSMMFGDVKNMPVNYLPIFVSKVIGNRLLASYLNEMKFYGGS